MSSVELPVPEPLTQEPQLQPQITAKGSESELDRYCKMIHSARSLSSGLTRSDTTGLCSHRRKLENGIIWFKKKRNFTAQLIYSFIAQAKVWLSHHVAQI